MKEFGGSETEVRVCDTAAESDRVPLPHLYHMTLTSSIGSRIEDRCSQATEMKEPFHLHQDEGEGDSDYE